MKTLLLSAGVVFAALSSAPALADSTTFQDQTLDYAYSGTGPSGYTGFGFQPVSGQAATQGDYLGNGFDTDKLVVTTTTDSLHLQYYTSFNGDDVGAHYADIFLATTNNTLHGPAQWNYGLALGDLIAPGGVRTNEFQDAAAHGFYNLPTYQTSQDIWGPLGTGWVYGGGYVDPSGGTHVSPTQVTGGSLMSDSDWTLTAQILTPSPGDPDYDAGYPYIVDVVLTAKTPDIFDGVFDTNDLDIFWGTGDCSNDALFASLPTPQHEPPPQPVPEPFTLSIFGAGLAGMAAYGRRRKKTA